MSYHLICPECGRNEFRVMAMSEEEWSIDGNGDTVECMDSYGVELPEGLHNYTCTDCDSNPIEFGDNQLSVLVALKCHLKHDNGRLWIVMPTGDYMEVTLFAGKFEMVDYPIAFSDSPMLAKELIFRMRGSQGCLVV